MRGRVSIHPGNGPGLSAYDLGQKGGTETNTLTTNQLPSHRHSLFASGAPASQLSPSDNNLAAQSPSSGLATYTDSSVDSTMGSSSIGSTGGGQPVNNLQPYLCVNYIIALEGVYPSRS